MNKRSCKAIFSSKAILATAITAMTMSLSQNAQAQSAETAPSLKSISDHWGGEALFPTEMFLVILGIVLVIIAIVSLWNWRKKAKVLQRRSVLFRDIVAEAELVFWQRWILIYLARREKLDSPLTLLVCPQTFEHHLEHYLDHSRFGLFRQALLNIEEQLFS